jgi:hypothetical protein
MFENDEENNFDAKECIEPIDEKFIEGGFFGGYKISCYCLLLRESQILTKYSLGSTTSKKRLT